MHLEFKTFYHVDHQKYTDLHPFPLITRSFQFCSIWLVVCNSQITNEVNIFWLVKYIFKLCLWWFLLCSEFIFIFLRKHIYISPFLHDIWSGFLLSNLDHPNTEMMRKVSYIFLKFFWFYTLQLKMLIKLEFECISLCAWVIYIKRV